VSLLVGLAIRSSVMLAAGLLLSAALARRSAALRHRVLATTLLGAAVVVLFSFLGPEWVVTLPGDLVDVTARPADVAADPLTAPAPQRQADTVTRQPSPDPVSPFLPRAAAPWPPA
jgi:hypothetical protein